MAEKPQCLSRYSFGLGSNCEKNAFHTLKTINWELALLINGNIQLARVCDYCKKRRIFSEILTPASKMQFARTVLHRL
jgi:hypothetical protein